MNKQARQAAQLDRAAQQAKSEGVSSFGRMTGAGWTPAVRAKYEAAARERGVEFRMIGEIGHFVDPEQD